MIVYECVGGNKEARYTTYATPVHIVSVDVIKPVTCVPPWLFARGKVFVSDEEGGVLLLPSPSL